MNKLTNKQELIIRQLYAVLTDEITTTQDDYNSLIELGLIESEVTDGNTFYFITEKGKNLIEKNGYIIKYPLTDQNGNGGTYLQVLKSMDSSAANALGKSIIATEFFKIWGKQNNINLLHHLENSEDYYNQFEHPLTQIDTLQKKILKANSKLSKCLNTHLFKIKHFLLKNRISLGYNSLKEKVWLVGIKSEGVGIFVVKDAESEVTMEGNYINDPRFLIPDDAKQILIREYFKSKSRQSKKTK